MADIYRVIRLSFFLILGVALGGFSVLAFASDTEIVATPVPNTAQSMCDQTTNGATGWAWKKATSGTPVLECQANGFTTYDSPYCRKDSPNYFMTCYYKTRYITDYTCPSGQNWTLSGTTCTRPACVAPQSRDPADGVCKAPALPACEPGWSRNYGVGDCISNTCPDGSARPVNGLCRGSACDNSNGQPSPGMTSSIETTCNTQGCKTTWWKYEGGSTLRGGGGECVPGEPPPPDCPAGTVTQTIGATTKCYPTTGSCAAKGMCGGSVNGVTICVACGSGTETKLPPSTGGKQVTQTPVSGPSVTTIHSEDETTKVTTDSNGNNSVTKSTTVTNPDGSKTTTTETQPQQKFCEENPNSSICKSSSFSDGGCTAPPACDGDAIQCAQANQAWKIKCNMEKEPEDAAYVLGKTLAGGGSDPSGNPLDPSKVTEVSISGIVSGAAGQRTLSGSCIASPSFTVLGRSFTFNTDLFCQFASIVGYLMVAASSIIAVRMVTSGAA